MSPSQTAQPQSHEMMAPASQQVDGVVIEQPVRTLLKSNPNLRCLTNKSRAALLGTVVNVQLTPPKKTNNNTMEAGPEVSMRGGGAVEDWCVTLCPEIEIHRYLGLGLNWANFPS